MPSHGGERPERRTDTSPSEEGRAGGPRDEPQGGAWAAILIAGLVMGIAGLFLPRGWSRGAVLLGCLLMAVAVVLLLLGGRRGDRRGPGG